MGTEPASAFSHLNESVLAYRERRVRPRTFLATGTEAPGKSISYGNELGEQPGGRSPQPVMDLDFLPVGWMPALCQRSSKAMGGNAELERPSHRCLSIYVFL